MRCITRINDLGRERTKLKNHICMSHLANMPRFYLESNCVQSHLRRESAMQYFRDKKGKQFQASFSSAVEGLQPATACLSVHSIAGKTCRGFQ